MRRSWRRALGVAALSAVLGVVGLAHPIAAATAEAVQVQGVEVHDGDTIRATLPDGQKVVVRLIGVDAPEIDGPYRQAEFGGVAATAFARRLIGSGPVTLERDPGGDDKDKYDRLLRYLRLPDGRDAGSEIIAAGYARAYRKFSYTRKGSYQELEKQAKLAARGLWGAGPATP
jgi:micrococcal nuclease